MAISCYAAFRPKQSLRLFNYDEEPLGPWDARVKISHCGICHSDIHLIDNDWGISRYPLVPGHEIVGSVEALGKNVKRLKKGSRVGIGWQAGSCLKCEWCKSGQENLCHSSKATCVGHYGGFATHVTVDSRFAFLIPSKLESHSCAPLLCGGITVFSPLYHHGITKGRKIGVVGIGGLGHLAVQYANAMGASVTAFSSSPSKRDEVKKLGADHFVSCTDNDQVKKLKLSFDFIISTVSGDLDADKYLGLLKTKGILCIVGASPSLKLSSGYLIGEERRIQGSVIGSPGTIEKMLQFSAKHNIKSRTECVSIRDVNKAVSKVRANQARYRMVLEV